MSATTYQQTIEYLYQRLPMFTRIGAAAIKKDLHNTLALMEALGNPHLRFKSIHVAGTNGKGSTSHMLAAIMHSAGYKTGLYTSPHLYDFRERIKVSGSGKLELVTCDFVVEFTQNMKPLIEQIEPSFFEVTVAMAFEWFARQRVDVAIIETGLGGRLDSTNIISPVLSIITNIGFDHTQLLGNTLGDIAFEKAGIIKNNTPVIIGESLPETTGVFNQKAKAENAKVTWAENARQTQLTDWQMEYITVKSRTLPYGDNQTYTCDLPGGYQQKNLNTVLTATDTLQNSGWTLPAEAIVKGLANTAKLTGLMGRWQVIGKQPYIVLDVAHNAPGIQQLLTQIGYFLANGTVQKAHLIIGMVKDKDIAAVLQLLPPHFYYYFTQAQLPRALPAIDLQSLANAAGLSGDAFATPAAALQAAKQAATPNDLIVVFGSVFVVAEIAQPQLM
jgi:dihydrofolate synthase/folylpolyglutamate synthase